MSRDALLDEIALRRASIEDAEREFAAGELSAEDRDVLLQRERAAIAQCEAAIALTPASPATARPRRRRALLWVALACFVAVAVVLLLSALNPRQPGDSVTGGIDASTAQTVAQDLTQAEIDQADGQVGDALAAYDAVLGLEPTNVEALTQSGWLTFSAGTTARDQTAVSLGEERVAEAVTLSPGDPDARLYYAIIAASTPGHRALAVSEFRTFLRLHPSTVDRALASPWLRRLHIKT